MKDNQKVTLTIKGKNEEKEDAPLVGAAWSVESGSEGVAITPSEDGTSCDVVGKNQPAGSQPLAFRVKVTAKAEESSEEVLTGFYDGVITNPPANSIEVTATDPVAQEVATAPAPSKN